MGRNRLNKTYSRRLDRLYSAWRRQIRMTMNEKSECMVVSTEDIIPSARQKYSEKPHSIRTIRS